MQTFIAVCGLNGAALDPQTTRALRERVTARLGGVAHWRELPGAVMGGTFNPISLDQNAWLVGDVRVDAREELYALVGLAASDEELILRAYEKWGEDCVNHLVGDFAFVIWDARRKTLFAARDKFGIRPLYHAQAGGVAIVANQMLVALEHPALGRQPSQKCIADFLWLGMPEDGETASFEALRRLPPAHRFVAQNEPRIERYWRLPVEAELRYKNPQDYVEQFRQVFYLAVNDRLRSPKISLSASGGMESGAVVAVLAEAARQRNISLDLRGFTVATSHAHDQERDYAAQTAAHIGYPISYFEAEQYELLAKIDLQENDGQLDDQTLNGLAASFDAEVVAHSRQIFNGQGGDPVLYPSAGYWLNDIKQLRWIKAAQAVREYRARASHPMRLYVRSELRDGNKPKKFIVPPPDWLRPEVAAKFGLEDRFKAAQSAIPPFHPTHQAAYNLIQMNQWQFLFERQQYARMERLMPFWDERVVRFGLRLPAAPWCEDKLILREAMRGRLPEQVRARPKTPIMADVYGPKLAALNAAALLDEVEPLVSPYVNMQAARSHLVSYDRSFIQYGVAKIVSLGRWLRRFG
jgi:asparagine synthase (glutamine-hydrolysing)